MRIFSVRDLKAKVFEQVILERNSAQAERSFRTAVNTKDSQYNRYPSDFQLYEMGAFDIDTGNILPHPTPILVCDASSLLSQE